MSVDSPKQNDFKAVIFDYGEVLCHKPTSEEMARLAGFFGVDVERLPAMWRRNRDPFDRGDLTAEAYWSALAEEAGISLSPAQLEQVCELDLAMWSSVNLPMVEWTRQLRAYGLRVGLLSNMHLDMVAHCRKHFSWLKEFDFLTFSGEVRLLKPDPAIYKHTLQGLKMRASEALFLDDRAVNVQGARAVGIRAIQFQSVSKLRHELQTIGFPVLPSSSAA